MATKAKKVLDPLGLTSTQFVLLSSIAWLTNTQDNVTQIDIANLNNFDRMMVSKVLRTLEEKKFIVRQEHNTDTRAKIVTLTEEGHQILQIALTKIETADIDFFESINQTLPSFNDNLKKLIDNNKNL